MSRTHMLRDIRAWYVSAQSVGIFANKTISDLMVSWYQMSNEDMTFWHKFYTYQRPDEDSA